MSFAVLLLILDDEQGAAVAEEVDCIEPVVEIGILLACIGHEGVERALGEEELVRGVVDLLPAEVPDVDPEWLPTFHGKGPFDDINTFR